MNDFFVTTSLYPNKKTFKDREEFCILGNILLLLLLFYKLFRKILQIGNWQNGRLTISEWVNIYKNYKSYKPV